MKFKIQCEKAQIFSQSLILSEISTEVTNFIELKMMIRINGHVQSILNERNKKIHCKSNFSNFFEKKVQKATKIRWGLFNFFFNSRIAHLNSCSPDSCILAFFICRDKYYMTLVNVIANKNSMNNSMSQKIWVQILTGRRIYDSNV